MFELGDVVVTIESKDGSKVTLRVRAQAECEVESHFDRVDRLGFAHFSPGQTIFRLEGEMLQAPTVTAGDRRR